MNAVAEDRLAAGRQQRHACFFAEAQIVSKALRHGTDTLFAIGGRAQTDSIRLW